REGFAPWDNLKKASAPIAQQPSDCLWRSVPENPTPLRSGRLIQSIDPKSEKQMQRRPPSEAASVSLETPRKPALGLDPALLHIAVVPAKRARLGRASASRDPVNDGGCVTRRA